MSEASQTGGRTQQERSERTRDVASAAALECLEEYGFAGTSTLRIQERAGISRGRLLHQFPSKNDLLVAAVQRMAQARFSDMAAPVVDVTPAIERARTAIRVLWMSHSDGLFWVATELWLAARLDDRLRETLLPEEQRLGTLIRQRCDALFGADIAALPKYRAFREVLISSMRGIALTYSFDRRDMATEPLVTVWNQMAADLLGLASA